MTAKKTTASTSKPASKKTTKPVVSEPSKPAKKAAKPTKKPVETVAAVTATPEPAAKKTTVKKAALTKSGPKVSPDAIARQAYLNYRRRIEQGLSGDSRGDWLEAERMLHVSVKS